MVKLIDDIPRMNELEDLCHFCIEDCKNDVYIYEYGHTQRMIAKYLRMSDILIKGFIVQENCNCEMNEIVKLNDIPPIYKNYYFTG